MSSFLKKTTILTSKIRIRPEAKKEFADWQAKLHMLVATFPGFVSLEILSPAAATDLEWMIMQRFDSAKSASAWCASDERKAIYEELNTCLTEESKRALHDEETEDSHLKENVTEIFITQVNPSQDKTYREWMSKIHRLEATFPGFKGMYVQAPTSGKGQNWITLLQFDTPENLDRWLNSAERQEILQEAQSLVASLDSHRVISPYAGWFASLTKEGKAPALWKQTMIILLVLFPIVMIELKYLSPLIKQLNSSAATFIGNAISVSLISWPMMPIAIWFLGWWLSPKKENSQRFTFLGTILVLLLYLVEIALFWDLLK